MKAKKKAKAKHRHRWEYAGDNCNLCGSYEALCKGCKRLGVFDGQGKLVEIVW